MVRMKNARRAAAGPFMLLSIILAATCSNPVNLLDELEREVMRANDRFLEITELVVPKDLDNLYNPALSISIRFDRDVDLSSVTPASIRVVPEGGAPVVWEPRSVSYLPASRTLKFRVLPVLKSQTTFNLTIDGVRGVDGSTTDFPVSATFETDDVLAGYVSGWASTDPSSNPGFTKAKTVNLSVAVNDMFRFVRYELMIDGKAEWPAAGKTGWIDQDAVGATLDWTGLDLTTLGAIDEEPSLLLIRFFGNTSAFGTGTAGTEDAISIVMDRIPPATPSVPSLDSSDDSGVSDSDGITNRTSALTFTGTGEPGSTLRIMEGAVERIAGIVPESGAWSLDLALAPGTHPLYAQAVDPAGNQASSSTVQVLVDTTAPAVSLTNPAGGPYYGAALYAAATASDAGGAGLDTVSFALSGFATVEDGSAPYGATFALDSALLPEDATYLVSAIARDKAGNQATASRSVFIDNWTRDDAFDFRTFYAGKAGSVSSVAFASGSGELYVAQRNDVEKWVEFAYNGNEGDNKDWVQKPHLPLYSSLPALAVDPEGYRVHVAYAYGKYLRYVTSVNDGDSWSAPVQLAGDALSGTVPAIALAPDGSMVHVVYLDENARVRYSMWEAGKEAIPSEAKVVYDASEGPASNVVLAVNGEAVLIGWRVEDKDLLWRAIWSVGMWKELETPKPIGKEGAGHRPALAAHSYRDRSENWVHEACFAGGAGKDWADFQVGPYDAGTGIWSPESLENETPYVAGVLALNDLEGWSFRHVAFFDARGELWLAKSIGGSGWTSYSIDRVYNPEGRGPSMASDGEWAYLAYYDEESHSLRFLKVRINLVP